MKTKIKLITKKRLLFALLLFATIIKSQSVGYQHDANGNRYQRFYIGLSLRVNPNLPAKDSLTEIQESRDLAMKYGLSVYPNPVKYAVNISINKAGDKPVIKDSDEKAIVYLMDINGKILDQQNYTGLENTFDMSNLLAGNYYVWVVFNKKESVYYKIVKVN